MKNRKILIILALMVLAIILFLILEKNQITHLTGLSSSDAPLNGPTKEQKKQEAEFDANKKQDFIEGSNSPDNSSSATANSISSLIAKRETDNTVTVVSKLTSAAGGKCNLLITNGEKVISLSADIIYQIEFSTCAGYSIPISDLGNGTWSLTLSLGADSSISKTISLEVN